MTEIRTANTADAALIADLSRETFYDTFAEFNTKNDMDIFLAEQFSTEKLMAEVGGEGHEFLIAYVDGDPAGYLFLKNETDPALPVPATGSAIEISRLYVRRNFIGKGIGKILMQSAITYAGAAQKTFLWLGVWEHNQRAIEFYTAFGFEKFGEQDFILGNDLQRDWKMGKQLAIRNY